MKKLSVCFLLVCAVQFSFSQPNDKRKYDQADKFTEVLNLIRSYYTDTVNDEKLVEDAIVKVLEDLDPHSSYTPAKDVKRSEEQLVGNFEGIGITFQILKDTIMVLEVIPSGPSEKVGLQAGDKIVKVNDTVVAGIKINNEGVIKKLRGPKGTKVHLSVIRRGEIGFLEFNIIRDKIPIFSVTASYMAKPKVGYLRIERFSATTVQEFTTAVTKLREAGMEDIILDLQGNVGGYLYTAIDMCNQFLGDHELIVFTKGEHAPYQPAYSDGRGISKTGRVVVMTDEGSASAAEILSGCIQDNDRGLLVGRRTFGKGLVQKPFTLADGSQVKLTTAHYYTPSGRCIQKPYGKGNKEYREDYKDRVESGELYGVDTFHFADSLHYKTKNGRDVYGGGGVKPDYFVAVDTSTSSPLLNSFIRKGTENKFCLEYVDRNRAALSKKYPDGDAFFNNFEVDTSIMGEYLAAAVTDSVISLKESAAPKTFWQYFGAVQNDTLINFEKDLGKSEKLLKARLKATIGRNLFDTGMWFRVINATVNPIFAKALEVIQNPHNFDVLKEENEKGNKSAVPEKEKKHQKKIKVTTEK